MIPKSQFEQTLATSLTLANASTIVSSVIRNIAGNDISNSLNGAKLTSEVIQTIASQRIVSNLKLN